MPRAVTKKLTGDDLVAIEVRALAVVKHRTNAHQRVAIAFGICHNDVPDLLVEIRRLRRLLGAQGSGGGDA